MSIHRQVEITGINSDGDNVPVFITDSKGDFDVVELSIAGNDPVEIEIDDLLTAIAGFSHGR